MAGLTNFLIAVDVMLATALVVVSMAQADRRYAARVREEKDYKAQFRRRD